MQYLSKNSKGLTTFDKSRKASNCQNFCNVAKVCYINNNMQDKFNQKYKNKMAKNQKLINTNNFVKKLSKEIRYNNIQRIRIFSNGDLTYGNMNKSIYELDNIIKLAKTCKFNLFWLTTRNFDTLFYYFDTLKKSKPDNINIMLSVDFENLAFIEPFCKTHKIQISFITDKVKESNCKSSKNHKSCIDNNCDSCFYYSDKPRIWAIHGKGNEAKFKGLK